MRLAILSDVHSNLHALDAVLDDVVRQSPDAILNLGDTVGYNAHPQACWDKLISRAKTTLLGNHDWAVAAAPARSGEMALDPGWESTLSFFNPHALAGVFHSRRNLDAASLRALRALTPSAHLDVDELSIFAFHGSPENALWEYVRPSAAESTLARFLEHLASRPLRAGVAPDGAPSRPPKHARVLVLLGHTHEPADVSFERAGFRGRLVNPGSVGQPRDGDSRAAYVIFDTAANSAELVRVPYDVESAARDIQAAGLPPFLGDRLFVGR